MLHTDTRYLAGLRRDVSGLEGITAYSEPHVKFAIQNKKIERSEGNVKMPYLRHFSPGRVFEHGSSCIHVENVTRKNAPLSKTLERVS